MRNRNRPTEWHVTWMSPTGVRTRTFHSLYQARSFANRVQTAGLEITSTTPSRRDNWSDHVLAAPVSWS